MTTVTIPQPDDWHVHLRDGAMLDAVVAATARRFRYAMVMPNLAGPITSVIEADGYRDRILGAAPPDAPDFRPWMTLYCSGDVDLDDLRVGLADEVVHAVKYYPAGATTNSAAGGTSMLAHLDLFEVLAEVGARLLVHAESTDPGVDVFDREAVFLERDLTAVCDRIPELLVTVEHVSTRAGVDFVADRQGVAATVTPHHLSRDRGHLLADGLRPDLYCKPVINSPADREALVRAVTGGHPAFALGTDSAPHATTAKYGPRGAAGVFNAAYGLEVTAEVFHQAGALDRLADFVSGNGQRIYGVEPPGHEITLTRADYEEPVPAEVSTAEGDTIVHFGTEEAARWTVSVHRAS